MRGSRTKRTRQRSRIWKASTSRRRPALPCPALSVLEVWTCRMNDEASIRSSSRGFGAGRTRPEPAATGGGSAPKGEAMERRGTIPTYIEAAERFASERLNEGRADGRQHATPESGDVTVTADKVRPVASKLHGLNRQRTRTDGEAKRGGGGE